MKREKKDWCTCFPDGSWGGECRRHDFHYEHHDVTRARADMDLARGVWRCGWPLTAVVMWFGVRLAGWWWWRKWTPIIGPMRRRKARRAALRRLDHAPTTAHPPAPGAPGDGGLRLPEP